MSFHVVRFHRSSRRRTCQGCGFDIAKGETYAFTAGGHEEGFYSGITHMECERLRASIYRAYDYGEGLPFSLPEIFHDHGEPTHAREDLDRLRGQFPNAVCRVEHRLRAWLEENDLEAD